MEWPPSALPLRHCFMIQFSTLCKPKGICLKVWTQTHPSTSISNSNAKRPYGRTQTLQPAKPLQLWCCKCQDNLLLPCWWTQAFRRNSRDTISKAFSMWLSPAVSNDPMMLQSPTSKWGYKCHQGAICSTPRYCTVRTAQLSPPHMQGVRQYPNTSKSKANFSGKTLKKRQWCNIDQRACNEVLRNEAEEHERQKIKAPTLPACYKCPWLDTPGSASSWKEHLQGHISLIFIPWGLLFWTGEQTSPWLLGRKWESCSTSCSGQINMFTWSS